MLCYFCYKNLVMPECFEIARDLISAGKCPRSIKFSPPANKTGWGWFSGELKFLLCVRRGAAARKLTCETTHTYTIARTLCSRTQPTHSRLSNSIIFSHLMDAAADKSCKVQVGVVRARCFVFVGHKGTAAAALACFIIILIAHVKSPYVYTYRI